MVFCSQVREPSPYNDRQTHIQKGGQDLRPILKRLQDELTKTLWRNQTYENYSKKNVIWKKILRKT